MTRANFRQADVERVIRAAKREGAGAIHVDLRNFVVTIIPDAPSQANIGQQHNSPGFYPGAALAQDGKENWDED